MDISRSAYSICNPFNSLYELPDIWMEWIQKGRIFFPSSGGQTFEMTNTMASRMHLFKKLEEEQVEGEFYEREELYKR